MRKQKLERRQRAQERVSLGVEKLKLKPLAPKPKLIKYCRYYLKGRCHEGDKCKFSHDTTPETKSLPCCHFATQSCMKEDDCLYDHDLSKYLQQFHDQRLIQVSFSPLESNNQTVREAIPILPAIQARVSSSVWFMKLSSQSNKRNSSDASSSSQNNEHATPPPIPPSRNHPLLQRV